MINKEVILEKRLSNFNNSYDEFEIAITNLLEGKNIKPSQLSKLRNNLVVNLRSLDLAIKEFCR